MPRGDDVRWKIVYNSPGIVVTGALAEYLLAVRVFAAREPDLQDIKHLAGVLGIDEAATRSASASGRTRLGRDGEDAQRVDAVADGREERGEP